MVATEVTARVAAPPQRVFDVANDLERVSEGFVAYGPIPGTVRAEVIGGGPLRQGASRRVFTTDGNSVVEEMLVFDRGHAVAYKLTGISPPFAYLVRFGRADWSFSETDSGTTVHWRYAFSLTTALAWPLAAPLVRIVFRRWMRRCLAAIGAMAEERAT